MGAAHVHGMEVSKAAPSLTGIPMEVIRMGTNTEVIRMGTNTEVIPMEVIRMGTNTGVA